MILVGQCTFARLAAPPRPRSSHGAIEPAPVVEHDHRSFRCVVQVVAHGSRLRHVHRCVADGERPTEHTRAAGDMADAEHAAGKAQCVESVGDLRGAQLASTSRNGEGWWPHTLGFCLVGRSVGPGSRRDLVFVPVANLKDNTAVFAVTKAGEASKLVSAFVDSLVATNRS